MSKYMVESMQTGRNGVTFYRGLVVYASVEVVVVTIRSYTSSSGARSAAKKIAASIAA